MGCALPAAPHVGSQERGTSWRPKRAWARAEGRRRLSPRRAEALKWLLSSRAGCHRARALGREGRAPPCWEQLPPRVPLPLGTTAEHPGVPTAGEGACYRHSKLGRGPEEPPMSPSKLSYQSRLPEQHPRPGRRAQLPRSISRLGIHSLELSSARLGRPGSIPAAKGTTPSCLPRHPARGASGQSD